MLLVAPGLFEGSDPPCNLSRGWLCGTVAHDSLSLMVVGHFLCLFELVLEKYFFWEFAHCVQIFKVIGLKVFYTIFFLTSAGSVSLSPLVP